MRYLLLILLPLLLFSKPFKVATYNVENLFDAEYVGTEYDDYTMKHNWTKRMVEIKLNHVAEVICDLDAEILGLQEIENNTVFEQLKKRLSRVGCVYRYAAITSKKNAPIQVALLSKFPIKHKKELQVSYSPRVRNILEVEVQVEGEPLTLFVNHWKSKAYQGYESKRIKYAKALQKRIATLPKRKEYILMGDFNSDYDASMSLKTKINDTKGKTGFTDVLKTKLNEEQIINAQKGEHYTLWRELRFDERWSTKFYGKRSSPDQIVLPQNLFDKKGIDYVNNSFKVFKAPYLFTKRGYINRWRYKNGQHRAKGYSDHLPVIATFDTKPYVAEKKKNIVEEIKQKFIDYFYTIEALDSQIKLEDAVVILKRGRNAIIKQKHATRGIYLYGCAGKLKEGHSYDLLVKNIKSYKGLKEITYLNVLKHKGKVRYKNYYLTTKDIKQFIPHQNEVVHELIGTYKNRSFYIGDKKIPIYFKKKKNIPKNGSKLKIHYAHVGYYKKLQLVVYNTKDFTVLE